jgi:hypothetical protein
MKDWKEFLEKVKAKTTIMYKKVRAENWTHDQAISLLMQDLIVNCMKYGCRSSEILQLQETLQNHCNELRKEY